MPTEQRSDKNEPTTMAPRVRRICQLAREAHTQPAEAEPETDRFQARLYQKLERCLALGDEVSIAAAIRELRQADQTETQPSEGLELSRFLELAADDVARTCTLSLMVEDQPEPILGQAHLFFIPILFSVQEDIPTYLTDPVLTHLAQSFRRYGLLGQTATISLDPTFYRIEELPHTWLEQRKMVEDLARGAVGLDDPTGYCRRPHFSGPEETAYTSVLLRFLVVAVYAESAVEDDHLLLDQNFYWPSEDTASTEYTLVLAAKNAWRAGVETILDEHFSAMGADLMQIEDPGSLPDTIRSGLHGQDALRLAQLISATEPESLDDVQLRVAPYRTDTGFELRIGIQGERFSGAVWRCPGVILGEDLDALLGYCGEMGIPGANITIQEKVRPAPICPKCGQGLFPDALDFSGTGTKVRHIEQEATQTCAFGELSETREPPADLTPTASRVLH